MPSFIAWRYYLILLFLSLAVAALACRVIDLAILDQSFLKRQGDTRVLRLISNQAFRGMITDRNGFPLAVSTSVYSAWMNPKEFVATPEALASLAKLVGMKPKALKALQAKQQEKKREFVYLKRSLSPEVANKIKTLAIPGVYLEKSYRRYYPEGEAAAHVVGFTNVDDQGQEGIELAYNNWLQGEPGKKWVIKDRLGRVIEDVQHVRDQEAGKDIVLSIDRRIQYLAYRELLSAVTLNQAKSGTAIVADIKTGEILAMVNVPSFNPNDRSLSKKENLRNRALTDTFEPGSTIKAFSITAALNSNKFKPDTMIDTHPGWMRVGHNVVKDHQNKGPLTVTQILQVSSNVGVTKMILTLPPDQLWELLHKVGFGESTGIQFPGEQNGALVRHQPWGAFTLATLGFGYGMSSNATQLTRAYAVLGNAGIKKPMTLLKSDQEPAGEQVISAKAAKQMLMMMESVVSKGGTAVGASVPGYRVAGKTGTAKLVKAGGGYEKHRYNSTFVGIAPVTNPRFVVTVIVNDPQGKLYYGGDVSGPAFEHIMEGTLRLYDVPPDKVVA